MRLQYPPNVRIIRTPCTGRLEVEFFMKAFEKGADGILVAGCLEGGCHFTEGNLLAKGRVGYTAKFLSESGLEEERIRMINVSAAGAGPLSIIINEMLETVRKLGEPGPSPLKSTDRANKSEMRRPMIVAQRKKHPRTRRYTERPQEDPRAGLRHLRHGLPGRRGARSQHHRLGAAHRLPAARTSPSRSRS